MLYNRVCYVLVYMRLPESYFLIIFIYSYRLFLSFMVWSDFLVRNNRSSLCLAPHTQAKRGWDAFSNSYHRTSNLLLASFLHIYIYIYIYIYVCVCVCVCVSVYICVYILCICVCVHF